MKQKRNFTAIAFATLMLLAGVGERRQAPTPLSEAK